MLTLFNEIDDEEYLPTPMEEIAPNNGKRTIQERFEGWLARNEEVESLYVRFSRDIKGRGFDTYSIAAITERIRWHYHTGRDTVEEFKISNDFRSRMARYLMEKYPDLTGLFNLRELREEAK